MNAYRAAGILGVLLVLATAAFAQNMVGEAQGNRTQLQEKLKGIVIPQLEFKEANIVDVVKYLDQLGNAGHTNAAPGDKGINFVLKLRSGEAGSKLPALSLSLRNISLLDAIKIITEVVGLTYRFNDNTVVITPLDGSSTLAPQPK